MGASELLRLARLLGQGALAAADIAEGMATLDAEQRRRLAALVDARIDGIAGALIGEAAASDDVTDPATALHYAEDALDSLSDLLSPEQRAAILQRFGEAAARWGGA